MLTFSTESEQVFQSHNARTHKFKLRQEKIRELKSRFHLSVLKGLVQVKSDLAGIDLPPEGFSRFQLLRGFH